MDGRERRDQVKTKGKNAVLCVKYNGQTVLIYLHHPGQPEGDYSVKLIDDNGVESRRYFNGKAEIKAYAIERINADMDPPRTCH